MPAVRSSISIHSFVTSSEQHLLRQYPLHETRLKHLLADRFDTPKKVAPAPASSVKKFTSSLNSDEVFSVLEKIHQLGRASGAY
jgi:hypothetical protein